MELEAFINGDKQKKDKKRGRTLRFELELAPPTEDSTNEFSYTDLVEEEERKKEGTLKVGDALDKGPDNQLVALAQRLEEKYGAAGSPKKKKQRVIESDLIDRGRGYDTNDSFVDDSEMYEDFVPPQVDTKFGGFYINTGDLEFKSVQPSEDEDMDVLVARRKKPKMKKQSSHQTPQSILASQKLKKAKLTIAAQKVPKPKANKVLFKTSSSLASSTSSIFGKTKKSTATVTKKKEKEEALGNHGLLKHNTVIVGDTASTTGGDGVVVSSLNDGGGKEQQQGKKETPDVPKPPPVLPGDLPEDISMTIKKFEESVARDQANTPEGKISIKTRCSYDDQLTELELACRKLHAKKRIAVLEYVSYRLGVSRATTVKRIRQVIKKREEEALVAPLQKLKEAVDASMPEQLQQYEQELKNRTDSLSVGGDKVSLSHVEQEEDITVDEVFDDLSNVAMEMKEAAAKSKRAPRKKYKWNEETRRLVCEVVKVKVESEDMIKGRTNGEELLLEFLDCKVKPLWPKGWMQKSILYKTTEAVHRHFTNPQLKKAVPSAKKTDKERSIEVKKESQVASGPSTVLTQTKTETHGGLQHLKLTASPPASDSNSKLKDKVEDIQWSVRSVGTGNGSPITIVRKTTPSSSSSTTVHSPETGGSESQVQITPRMAQLLSSVASSQSLVKASKSKLGSASKMASSSSSPQISPTVKKPEKNSGHITLHSDVQALLTQFQSAQVKFPEVTVPQLPSLTRVGSVVRPPQSTPNSQTPLSNKILSGLKGGGGGGSGKGIASPGSKITTSPIQMKAIVSQLKPKATSQGILTKPSSPSYPLHTTTQGMMAVTQSSFSVSSSARLPPVKVVQRIKKSSVPASTTGAAVNLSRNTTAGVAGTQHHLSNVLVIPSNTFPASQAVVSSNSQSDMAVIQMQQKKKQSPPKGNYVSEIHTKPHPHTSPPTKRPNHSGIIQQKRVRSTSPLTNSNSSSSSSSPSQSHLPLSAIVQHMSLSPSLTLSPSSSSLSSQTTGGNRFLSPVSTGVIPSGVATGVLPSRGVATGAGAATGVLPSRGVATGAGVATGVLHSRGVATGVLPSRVATGVLPSGAGVATGVLPSRGVATGVLPSRVATGVPMACSTLYSTNTLVGTPLTAVLEQQPTYIVSSRQNPVMNQNSTSMRSVLDVLSAGNDSMVHTATTIPFSSCASTFILTSPLSHQPPNTPPNTYTHHHTTTPRTLTISPPTVPLAGTQVLVAGITGAGIKSPVEQIYMEHSYGSQSGGSDGTEAVINSNSDSEIARKMA